MGEFKYILLTRYEFFGKNGIEWTKWFRVPMTPLTDNEEEINKHKEHNILFSSEISKKTKLKHEYKIEYIDIDTLPKILPKRKRGRPKNKTR